MTNFTQMQIMMLSLNVRDARERADWALATAVIVTLLAVPSGVALVAGGLGIVGLLIIMLLMVPLVVLVWANYIDVQSDYLDARGRLRDVVLDIL